jgi:hypothetical protein
MSTSPPSITSSLLEVDTAEASIVGIWGRIMFWTVVSCGTLHGCFGLLASVKLVADWHAKSLFVPITYFVVGAAYTFLRCSFLAFTIALVHFSLSAGLYLAELAVYVMMLTMLTMFFSSGRIPNLYAM